jgi:hypothetical protein
MQEKFCGTRNHGGADFLDLPGAVNGFCKFAVGACQYHDGFSEFSPASCFLAFKKLMIHQRLSTDYFPAAEERRGRQVVLQIKRPVGEYAHLQRSIHR